MKRRRAFLYEAIRWTAAATLVGIATAASSATASTATASLSSCPSRTVNYITHTLPQQCLRTNWAENRTSTTSLQETPAADYVLVNSTTTAVSTEVPPATTGSITDSIPHTPASSVESETAPSTAVEPSTSVAAEDADAPLDAAKFLSFEEWKKENLARARQAREAEIKNKKLAENRRRPGDDQSLDSFGDELEINLNFGSYEGESATTKPKISENPVETVVTDLPEQPTGKRRLPKDAGKTCKERSSFASFDCGASVLKTSPGSKGATSILVENKDVYMLNQCKTQNKFFIVELCQDILIDTIVLANYEFFSSTFRHFRVSVSNIYPVKLDEWKVLGEFEARNTREIQAFLIENPLIWARYLRIELLTHYGKEHFCPLSLLRVHGMTYMDDLNHQEENREDSSQTETESAESVSVKDVTNSSAVAIPENETATDVVSVAAVDDEYSMIEIESTMILPFNWTAHPSCDIEDEVEESVVVESGLSVVSEKTTVVAAQKPSSTPVQSASTGNRTSTSQRTEGSKAQTSAKTSESGSSVNGTSSSATQPHSASPTTQDSFFKTVNKRLQLLEANATLSLQYIEEQSRILRDAFAKVDKRQMTKTTSFLDYLNKTVTSELKGFRSQYDQLWQSTVLELETQREHASQEILAMSTRLSILADEVVFQKRMAIVQSFLLLFCVGLVIFSRSSQLELPLLQSMMARSSMPTFESPPNSPPTTRPVSRHRLYNQYSPEEPKVHQPYPPSRESSRFSNDTLRGSPSTPDLRPEIIISSQSGPSTPSGRRERNSHFHESWGEPDFESALQAQPLTHSSLSMSKPNDMRAPSPLSERSDANKSSDNDDRGSTSGSFTSTPSLPPSELSSPASSHAQLEDHDERDREVDERPWQEQSKRHRRRRTTLTQSSRARREATAPL